MKKIGCLLMMLSLFVCGIYAQNDNLELHATAERSQTLTLANTCDALELKLYGEVVIQEGNVSDIQCTVALKTYGRNQEVANERLEDLTIQSTEGSSTAAPSFSVQYTASAVGRLYHKVTTTITIPSSVALKMEVNNGNVTMADLSQPLYAVLSQSNLRANDLKGTPNFIKTKAGKLEIHSMKAAQLLCDKSTVKIEIGQSLTIHSSGSHLTIGTITDSLAATLSVDNLKIDNLQYGFIESAATCNINVDKVNKVLICRNIERGSIDVDAFGAEFEEFQMNGKWTTVNLAVTEPQLRRVDLDLSNCAVNTSITSLKSAVEAKTTEDKTVKLTWQNTSIATKGQFSITDSYGIITIK